MKPMEADFAVLFPAFAILLPAFRTPLVKSRSAWFRPPTTGKNPSVLHGHPSVNGQAPDRGRDKGDSSIVPERDRPETDSCLGVGESAVPGDTRFSFHVFRM